MVCGLRSVHLATIAAAAHEITASLLFLFGSSITLTQGLLLDSSVSLDLEIIRICLPGPDTEFHVDHNSTIN